MADLTSRLSVLPSIARPRERAIGAADAAVEDRSAAIVLAAGGPDIDAVPAVYLPARAEARSVDVWDPLWPESVQRAVIVAAPEVHRHKGTVYAVKAALAALSVDATVTEWWQEIPKGAPYTFGVRAYARARLYDGPVLDARLIRVVHASIMRAKPLSRAFDLTVGAMLPDVLGLAPILTAKVAIRRTMSPVLDAKSDASLGLAGVLIGKVVVRRTLRPTLDARTDASLGVAGILVGRTRVRATFLLRP